MYTLFVRTLSILLSSQIYSGQIINGIAPNTHVQTVYQHHVGGGDLLGSNIPFEQCDALCRTNPTCVSFDWVKDPPRQNIQRCFRHSWISTCNGYAVRKGIIHVDYMLCTIGPCLTGGTVVNTATHDECLFLCRQNTTCASAQVLNSRCRNNCVHFSVFELCSTTPAVPPQQCRNYRRTSCEAIGKSVQERALALTSTSSTTFTTPSTTTTTASAARGLVQPRKVLQKLDNSHVQGGILQRNIREVDLCLQSCSTAVDCFAVDFLTLDNSCWFHTATSGCSATKPLNSSTHHKFIQCYRNTHQYGGEEVPIVVPPGGSPLNVCIERCSAEAGCYGVDFNRRNLRCFQHSNTSECHSRNEKYGCDHFRMQNISCQAQTTRDDRLTSYIIKGPFEEPVRWMNLPGQIVPGTENNSSTTNTINTSQRVIVTKIIPLEAQNAQQSIANDKSNSSTTLKESVSSSSNSATNDPDTGLPNDSKADITNPEITEIDKANVTDPKIREVNDKINSEPEDSLAIGEEDVPDLDTTMDLTEDHPDIIVKYPEVGPITFNRDGSLKLKGAFEQDTTSDKNVSVAIIKTIQKGTQASVVANHLIPGGVKQDKVMTFPGCITACNQSKDCLAIDYDFNKHQCFFHSVTTVCSDLKALQGLFHVRFAKCPIPVSEEILTVNANSPGGALQTGIRNYQTCHTGCQNSERCRALDYSFYSRTCYYHTKDTECATLGVAPGVVHITKKNCS